MSHSFRIALFALAMVALGAVAGWFLHSFFGGKQQSVFRGTVLRNDTNQYPLISPLLACDVGSEDAFPEFQPLKTKLNNIIDAQMQSGSIGGASIYLRSMKGGRWFAINGDTKYAPASLLKVFIMVAYYKEAESNPEILQKQLAFEGSPDSANDTPGEVIPHLVPGRQYSVEDIIRQMIVYSDNDALNTLVDNFDQNTFAAFTNMFTELNIPSPAKVSESTLNFMSVSEYSLVFRVLFGATYLSDSYSEKALQLLSQAQYKQGVVAGVPASVSVAHKFGVTTLPATASAGSTNELHDCGIVYYPNHPYLLCVMTRGNNFAYLQQFIKDISNAAYAGVDTFYTHK